MPGTDPASRHRDAVTSLAVSLAAATLSAALYALASALQHRSTADVRLVDRAGYRSLIRFAHRTVRHHNWLLGTAASVTAVTLHAIALHAAPLVLVQPVMVSGVVFALPLRSRLDRTRIARSEMAWAALLAAALAGFLVVAIPAAPTRPPTDPVPAVIVAVLVGACAVACLWAGRGARGARPALLLGTAAGLAFAGSAALIKATTDVLGQGHDLLTSWPLYALVLVGLTGLFINQLAFQAGPLRWSLPAISTVDPITSLIIGIVVYDERLRSGMVALSLELLLLAVVIGATIALAKGDAEPRIPPQRGTARPLSARRAT